MPTYEYRCLECGRLFEEFQSMTDDPLETCRFCEGKVKRLIGTGAGIIFKGSGFYCTDYRDSSYKSRATAETQSDKASTSGTGTKDSSSTKAAPAKAESKAT